MELGRLEGRFIVTERDLTGTRAEGKGPCWLWSGSINKKKGYANSIRVHGERIYPHRYSFERVYGEIPEGYDIDHLCRTRHCVAPRHLQATTRAENVRRGAWAKLSLEQAKLIRDMYKSGEYTQPRLAELFQVTRGCIQGVISGRTWVAPGEVYVPEEVA